MVVLLGSDKVQIVGPEGPEKISGYGLPTIGISVARNRARTLSI